MMKMKHTPGPWEVAGNLVRTVPEASGGGMCGGFLIAEVPISDENRHPNARLLAAAPDLLGALEGLIMFHLGEFQVAAARAAIAKAKGE